MSWELEAEATKGEEVDGEEVGEAWEVVMKQGAEKSNDLVNQEGKESGGYGVVEKGNYRNWNLNGLKLKTILNALNNYKYFKLQFSPVKFCLI